MQYFRAFVLACLLLAASACAARGTPPPSTPELRRAVSPLEAAPAPGFPPEIVATAKRLLETPAFTWIGEPQPVLVQEMTFSEAARRIPPMSDPEYSPRRPDTPVWLVILMGEAELMPMGPPGATLVPNRARGCTMVLFTARDSQLIAVGDTLCPGG